MGTMHKHPASQPNMPAVARILSAYDRESLEAFLSVALDLLDTMDGEPDLEDGDPAENDGTGEGDQAWIEWHTMRGASKRGSNIVAGQEDDEDDDPAEESDDSGQCDEDGINTAFGNASWEAENGAGCPISDPGGGNVEDEGQMWFAVADSAPIGLPASRMAANDS